MLANMGMLIGQTARRYAGRTALINVERNRRYTYDEMHRLSNRMSHVVCEGFGLGAPDSSTPPCLKTTTWVFFIPGCSSVRPARYGLMCGKTLAPSWSRST
jgi:acyl-CoA synthetase (AMP-forming)/AMP-acid ligase II